MGDKSTKPISRDSEASRAAMTQMIIKLRWFGMEDEARRLALEARLVPAERRGGLAFVPVGTD
jgi:hypothetical protein